jgi:hypothetical protein
MPVRAALNQPGVSSMKKSKPKGGKKKGGGY